MWRLAKLFIISFTRNTILKHHLNQHFIIYKVYRILNKFYSRPINPKATQRISILEDGTLEIQAVRAADVGYYTCSIKSPGGNETRSAKLSVIELPYAPTNVKAERLEIASQRAVNVSWIPGFDGNSPIKEFIIQTRELPELGTYVFDGCFFQLHGLCFCVMEILLCNVLLIFYSYSFYY